jgi:hypothetical protein
VFFSWTNEQETSKRGGGDVFIHPTVKSNRYQQTQQNTHWPDAPVDVTGRAGRRDRTRRSSVTVENQNDTAEWPDAPIRDDRTRPIVQEPYYTLTWRSTASDQSWLDMSGQLSTLLEHDRTRSVIFQSRLIILLPSETRVRLINTSGPHKDRVRSTRLKTQWLLALTGRVRSWQRPRPVKGKQLKQLRNKTQLEPSCFQLNFELFLSYLVLS